jgi:hypothetical protein
MRKIVITSGLGLVAAAMPAHAAPLPVAVEPSGVSDAGRVALATTPVADTQTLSPYDKMNAEAQMKIKGDYKINKAGDAQIKTQDQIKGSGESQIKMKSEAQQKFKAGAFKFGSGGGEGVVRPNCLQGGQ